MFIFALLSTFLVLLRTRAIGNEIDRDSLETSASITIPKNTHGDILYVEPVYCQGPMQSSRRRLLEYPRSTKQAYRSGDYNVIRRRHQSWNKLDEGRSYRSVAKNDEDEDEDEEEEDEEDNEGNKIDDETIDEEAADQQNNEDEETVEDAARNRVARSGYVPFEAKVGERERQEAVRIRSASEECEDESTEAPQYYEYETDVRNVASQDGDRFQEVSVAKMLGVNFLIWLLI